MLDENKKTAWQKYKENLGNTRPWDFVNPNTEYADKELADKRFSICLECPKLFQKTKQCKECGCFMIAKTKLKEAECPLGKW